MLTEVLANALERVEIGACEIEVTIAGATLLPTASLTACSTSTSSSVSRKSPK